MNASIAVMVAASLLSTLLLALFVAAQPTAVKNSLVRLPFVKRISDAGPHNLIKQDQLRIQGLKANAEGFDVLTSRQLNSGANNQAASYVASVGVGNPPTQCK